MQCNWRRWLWGVIPLIMLCWVAIQAERFGIEDELTQTAKTALTQRGSGWAKVAFEGRDAVLSGRAADETDAGGTAGRLLELRGVRVVDNRADLIAKVDIYVWSASRSNNRITLAGFVPNAETRQVILGAAKASLPGYDINDRTTPMRGVPSADTWLAGVSFALKQLGGMHRGEVKLENLGLSVVGEAESLTSYRVITAALANDIPKGIRLTLGNVTAPRVSPYIWSAQWTDGRIDLSGHVPDEPQRTDLLATAKSCARADTVDRMQPGDGAPPDWLKTAAAAVRALCKLDSGTAELKDTSLVISGVAADDATVDALRTALRADLPSTIKLTDQVRAREPRPAPVEKREPPVAKVDPPAKTDPPVVARVEPPNEKVDPPAAKIEPPVAKIEPPVAKLETQPEPKAEPKSEPKPQPKSETTVTKEAVPETKQQAVARVCQATLLQLATSGHILFERASARLDTKSSTTLSSVASAVKDCPDVIVRIEGHTDIEGTVEANEALSLRRAQAVRRFLVNAGVDALQLEPAGFGQTRPVVPNDSKDNKAKNRRIEFAVRPK